MFSILKNYAIDNVWCNPEQDNQLIFDARKISSPYGELNSMRLLERRMPLPKDGKRYHVFQIGQLHPTLIGLLDLDKKWVDERWIPFSEAMSGKSLVVTLYTRDGVYLPRTTSYYCYTKERALIYAVEVNEKIPLDYEDDVIYSRFYSNAYFQGLAHSRFKDGVECVQLVLTHSNHILQAQALYNSYVAKKGYTSVYCNGLVIDAVSPLTVKLNDVVEIVYDSSVKRALRFCVADLPVFFSERDGKNKYLLHHLCDAMQTIEYQDDIEINVLYTNEHNRFKGLYYHRNQEENHRMVTHRDYSITVDHFQYVAKQLEKRLDQGVLDFHDFEIQLLIRESGYHRPLVYESSRIFELYKLPSNKILSAMVGVNSTLDIWKASNLENSAYVKLMGVNRTDITPALIEDALGYNSISKVLGETPVRPRDAGEYVITNLNPAQYKNSTIYEYSENGRLIGWRHHASGMDYISSTPNAKLLEVLTGKGCKELDQYFGEDLLPIPTDCSYKVYMCYLVSGVPNLEWVDITDSNHYRVEEGKLHWNNLESGQWLMVRTDKCFLSYDLAIERHLGILSFDLTEQRTLADGSTGTMTLDVPLGQLDVFLNGRSLIRGLDYVLDFPKVVIVNKDYLVPGEQNLHVRFYSFATEQLELDKLEDFGFISHDLLSANNRFDIRDDKVLRITVNGELKTRDDVRFAEEHSGVSIVNTTNGMPYQVKDIVVPFRGLTNRDTYALRKEAQQLDALVEDYMSLNLPEPTRDEVDAIRRLYPLVSPFASGLLYAFQRGLVGYDDLSNASDDMAIMEICRPYEYLLEYDPINEELGFDYNYVIVHPHHRDSTIELRFHQYRVLLRAMHLYTGGKVDISSFFTFTVE